MEIESRSSSPVRIIKDDRFQASYRESRSLRRRREYAEGIMTASVDETRCANEILESN